MQNIPLYIPVVFILTTLYAVWMFVKAANGSKIFLYLLAAWLVFQAFIASSGFYTHTKGLPPRFMLAILPPLICVVVLLATVKGRFFLDNLNLSFLTLIHLSRVPVELVLFWLFVHKAVPKEMTFEGYNYDILSGITAIGVWFLVRHNTSRRITVIWNIICLVLLLNIVIVAILSAPFDFQIIALDQPNIALLYFPYVWLPACIVPLVLISHIAAIRQLHGNSRSKSV